MPVRSVFCGKQKRRPFSLNQFHKYLGGVFPAQCDYGVPHQKGAHPPAGSLQYAGKGFVWFKTKIQKTLFHMMIAGNPDYFDLFARFDSA